MSADTKENFIQAFSEQYTALNKYIFFRVNDWEMAEDITQEVFLKTWKYIMEGNKPIKNLRQFFFKVARNLIIRFYRSKHRATIPLESIEVKNLEDTAQSKMMENIANKILLEKYTVGLDELYQRIIIYKYFENLEIKEISRKIGRSENYVSVMLYRANKNLRKRITGSVKK